MPARAPLFPLRFAVEQGCPEDRVVVDERGGTLYRARGCEKETIYACGAVASFRGGACVGLFLSRRFPVLGNILVPHVCAGRKLIQIAGRKLIHPAD